MISKLEDKMNGERERLPSLSGEERKRLKTALQKVDAALGKIETNHTTTTNDLCYEGATLVNDLIGVKKDTGTKKQEPWWKRRFEGEV